MKLDVTDEKFVTIILIVIATFLWVNFDSLIGGVYTSFVLLYLISITTKQIPFVQIYNASTPIAISLITAGVLFSIYLIIAGFTITYINPNLQFTLLDTSVIDSIAEKTQLPIFSSSNATIRFLVYGLFIPIAESLFALSLVFGLFSKGLNAPLGSRMSSFKIYWVAIIIGMVMAFFHATVRQFSGYALITDAIFFSLSVVLVYYRKQILDATLFHVILNSFVLTKAKAGL